MPAWKKVVTSGSNANLNQITASIISSPSITGSLFGTSSWAVTSSHSLTASFVNPLRQDVIITGSLIVSGSPNAEIRIIGETSLSGSTSISGSLAVTNAVTSSVILISGSNPLLRLIGSGSELFSVDGASGRLFTVSDDLTNSLFSVNTISGLPVIEAFATNDVNLGKFGTYPVKIIASGTLAVVTGSFTGSLTGVLTGTASWAQNSLTASSVTNLNQNLIVTGSVILSGSVNPELIVLGDQQITGSLRITNGVIAQSFTGSLFGTSSWALTSSYGINTYISGSITNTDSVQFNTTPPSIPIAPGKMLWDSGEGTLQLGLAGGNVDLNLGEQLYQYVYNAEATTLTLGTVVYVSSSQGGRIAVKRASATAEQGSANTLGFTAEAIGAGAEGWVMTEGSLRGVDTTGYTPGSLIFLSESAGQYTQTFPQAPLHSVRLGYAQKIDASGIIYVKIDNGYEIDELHDIKVTNAIDGDLFVRSGSLWINNKQLTGSYGLTGSLRVTNGGITSSLFGTSSWAQNSVTASYITGSVFTTANPALSASYSLTASYALNAGGGVGFPYTGSAQITGSLGVTGSISATGTFTASLSQGYVWVGGAGNVTTLLSTSSFGTTGANRKYTQSTPATTWSFAHALGEQYPVVQVYDSSGGALIPGRIETIDTNNLNVYFDDATSGIVVATVGGTATQVVTTSNLANTASYVTPLVQNVIITGSLLISSSITTISENTDVDTGTETIATVFTGSYRGAFFDYTLNDGTNYRAGTVSSIWNNSGNVTYTDNSTPDIGNTSGVTLFVAINGSNAELRATVTTNNWNIKSFVRAI
jgi:hypothetical protein